MKTPLLSIIICCFPILSFGQTGILKGMVLDDTSNERLPGATVLLDPTDKGTITDIDGGFVFGDLEPGLYNLQVSFIGYETKTIFEIQVNTSRPAIYDVKLKRANTSLEEVVIVAEVFKEKEESPVSLRTIGVSEIERNPGGNRDISKVIQSLPGVASSPNFRNDIIIRGGPPNENKFFLDGIEVPNINHFNTQGSNGGPVGLINVNFIKEVDLYTGAFPANRGNALSSVMELTQKDANTDKGTFNFTLGSSDVGLTYDGPLGPRTGLIISARRSYLQFLFEALKLPFLPTYNDMQAKLKHKINQKNEVTFVALGAYDDFVLNPSSIENVNDQEILDRNIYFLGNIPENSQWSYTAGVSYRHFGENSFQTVVASRNHLNNQAIKYENNSGDANDLIFDYVSEEIENKFRFESTHRINGWKLNGGFNFETVTYTNSTFRKDIQFDGSVSNVDFDSAFDMNKYGLFGQASKTLAEDRLVMSFGWRLDAADYSSQLNNPFDQFSPRFSLSYKFAPTWSVNFNTGRFYQLPAFTVLGFRNQEGELANKNNGITYIRSDHLVAGIKKSLKNNTQVSLEGFYKKYDNYPFLLRDSISLANLGADFGVVGNEEAVSISKGRAYGIELLAQRKLKKGIYGILAVTYVRSEFQDKTGRYVPSGWDNQYIVTFTGGKKFKKNWELGVKWRFFGGAPYTPWDLQRSALIDVWNATRTGVRDFDRLNAERIQDIHQLDLRIDKRYYFDKWTLDVYFDVENIYNFQFNEAPYIDVIYDESGNPTVDPEDPARYLLRTVENPSGNILPSIGIVAEF